MFALKLCLCNNFRGVLKFDYLGCACCDQMVVLIFDETNGARNRCASHIFGHLYVYIERELATKMKKKQYGQNIKADINILTSPVR